MVGAQLSLLANGIYPTLGMIKFITSSLREQTALTPGEGDSGVLNFGSISNLVNTADCIQPYLNSSSGLLGQLSLPIRGELWLQFNNPLWGYGTILDNIDSIYVPCLYKAIAAVGDPKLFSKNNEGFSISDEVMNILRGISLSVLVEMRAKGRIVSLNEFISSIKKHTESTILQISRLF